MIENNGVKNGALKDDTNERGREMRRMERVDVRNDK